MPQKQRPARVKPRELVPVMAGAPSHGHGKAHLKTMTTSSFPLERQIEQSYVHAPAKIPSIRQPELHERRLGRKKAADPRDNNWLAADHLPDISPDREEVIEASSLLAKRGWRETWELPTELRGLERLGNVAPAILEPYADLGRLFRYHWQAETLNQKSTSRCTWFGGEQLLRSGPVTQKEQTIIEAVRRTTGEPVPDIEAARWAGYFWLQDHDEWPGREPTYYGSSERAVGEWFIASGFTKQGYFWIRTVTEAARAIINGHIIGIGSDWFGGFDYPKPDKNGDLFVELSGAWRGGHFFIFDGCNIVAETPDGYPGKFRKHGSWGDEYGHKGSVYFSFATVDYLIRTGAGMFIIPELKLKA